jgi:integrase
MLSAAQFAELTFEHAAEEWLESKKLHNAPKTIKSYRDYLHRAIQGFSGLRLKNIHIGHFEEYQRQNAKKYHPTAVNHDLNAVSQILRKANLWKAMQEHYKPLRVPKWRPPKVLTEEQENAFFKLAASNHDWALAYWVASLTSNTSASGVELRMLQIKHVLLDQEDPILYVPDGKNQYRPRTIWLNEVGVKQMRRMLDRASSLGATQPEHYIFPFRVKRNFYDPTRPTSESWLKKIWKKLVDEAIQREIIPFRITPHDLRHQIITKLLEAGTPENTVMAIAGHVRREMLEHYSHTRIAAKKAALSAILPKKRNASVGF